MVCSVPALLCVPEEPRVAVDKDDSLSLDEADACLGPVTAASVTGAELVIPPRTVTVGSNPFVVVAGVVLSTSPGLLLSMDSLLVCVDGRLCVELL